MDNTTRNRVTTLIIGIILLIAFMIFGIIAKAQDRIVTTGGDTIVCFIDQKTDEFVLFRYHRNDLQLSQLSNAFVKDILFANKSSMQYAAGKANYIPTHHFCEIIVVGKLDSVISVKISGGKETENYQLAPELFEKNKTYKSFPTFIDAINFMDALGYKTKESYIINLGNFYEYHYIMYTGLK